MRGPQEGGCQCGAVRYRVTGEPLALAACHCTLCQRQSGSAFGLSLAVRRDDFALLSGELATFTVTCDSGRRKECLFCPACGTRIVHRVEGREVVSVKAGTLDDTSGLSPTLHIWVRSRQPWVLLPEDAPRYETEPPG